MDEQKVRVTHIEGKGRGVLATELIPRGEIIEVCPVTPLSVEETRLLKKTRILKCLFDWGSKDRLVSAIVHGYGMLYNHSKTPNADWDYDYPAQSIVFKALSDISPGQEICYDYRIPLWFEER